MTAVQDVSELPPVTIGPTWSRTADGGWVLPARTLGWEILGWTARWLRQPDGPDAGSPWKFTPEQARFILNWYAVGDEGRFSYRYGTLRRLKGWGKDPFAASIALVELCGPCRFDGWSGDGSPRAKSHPAPWVQVAAVNQEQTRNTMTLFPGMVSDDAKAEFDIDLGKTIVYANHGKARLEAVTSSPRALEGGRATFVIANEIHHWLKGNDGHDMFAVIARNAGKARDASSRALSITNAHLPGEDSVGERDFDAFEKERTGEIEPSGRLYDSLEAPAGLDPKNPDDVRAGILAARGDSNWAPLDRVVQEFMDPAISNAQAQRFYWNKIVGSDASWIDLDAWTALKRDVTVEPHTRICLGFDGSLREDSTALVACRLEDGHIWTLHIWEKPDGPIGNGWQVPRSEVDGYVDQAFRDYDVIRMYCDPPYWQDYVNSWAAKYGDSIVMEFWTNVQTRMAKALERLHTSIMAAELTHDGDVTLTRHIGNAIAVVRAGGTQVNKRKQSDKIDGLVATSLAYEARNDAVAAGALATANYFSWDEL